MMKWCTKLKENNSKVEKNMSHIIFIACKLLFLFKVDDADSGGMIDYFIWCSF